jgi:tetratricopeptide (TPR) repeat protein
MRRGWCFLFLVSVAQAQTPTFAHDIAPILFEYCAPCHRPGEAGPFPLLTYLDAKKHAQQIALVTGSRFMPPWLPEPGHGDFAGVRRLSAEQIRMIADWLQAGEPEGPASDTPPAPRFTQGWQLGQPDVVLEAQGSFDLPAGGQDVYWNFIFNPDIKQTRYVKAIEIRPGERRLVHHANLIVDRSGSSQGKGFSGMDLTIMRSPFDPVGHFLFWKPGAAPHVEGDGFSWRLDPGNELILNAHLQPSGKPEEVRPTIGLYFTDHPPTRFPMLLEMENDRALAIPAGAGDFVIADDFRLPLDVDVLAVYPHAHYLGKLLEAYATLPSGEKKWLVRIPDWNQDWQAVYYYREPLFLPKGTAISMRYHYDNSGGNVRNPNRPPRLVQAGNQATDEMGHLWLQVLPRARGDQRRELEEAILLHRLEKDPESFEAHFNLGVVMLSRFNLSDGVKMLRAAVALDPKRPEAHNALGVGLGHLGLAAEALAEFRAALKQRPDYASARFNLAEGLQKSGHLAEAIQSFRQVISAYPSDDTARYGLQRALEGQAREYAAHADWKGAAAAYGELVELSPRDAGLRNDYGEALLQLNQTAQAREQFEKALEIDPALEAARRNWEALGGKRD